MSIKRVCLDIGFWDWAGRLQIPEHVHRKQMESYERRFKVICADFDGWSKWDQMSNSKGMAK